MATKLALGIVCFVGLLAVILVVAVIIRTKPRGVSDEVRQVSSQGAGASLTESRNAPLSPEKQEPVRASPKIANAARKEVGKQGIARDIEPDQSASGSEAGPFDLPTLIKRIEPAVVRIDTDKGVGTGFLIENDSTVVTNFHVIHGSSKATATFQNGSRVSVLGALAVMPENDVAALLLSDHTKSRAPLRLAAEAPQKGERVVAFGMPEGLSFSASEGIVSAMRTGRELGDSLQASTGIDILKAAGLNPDSAWVQTSAPISHGNSGGPLVNMRGEVVGVNTMMHAEGQNLNFAVSAAEIKRLADLARTPIIPLGLLPKPATIPRPRFLSAEKDALKGLVGVQLTCGDISREAARWGMGQEEVRALVERKLRSAGIKVVTPSDSEGPIGMLYVNVNVLASENQTMPILVYVFDCELSRFVAVNPYAKDQIDLTLATVWKARGSYGYAGRQVFEKAMREGLDRVIDQFVDAFRAVNDK